MDIVEEGINGHLVDTKDSVALADRMQTVLQLPVAQWRQMSDAALATATHYSWHDATLKFEQALRRAIDQGEAASDTPTSSAADAASQRQ